MKELKKTKEDKKELPWLEKKVILPEATYRSKAIPILELTIQMKEA